MNTFLDFNKSVADAGRGLHLLESSFTSIEMFLVGDVQRHKLDKVRI